MRFMILQIPGSLYFKVFFIFFSLIGTNISAFYFMIYGVQSDEKINLDIQFVFMGQSLTLA